jgi:hypothetical protein
MSNLAEHHGYALKNLLQYLQLTALIKLRYRLGGAHLQLVIYSNAN